jgi:hypothetical protein
VDRVIGELTEREVVAQFPAVASEDEERAYRVSCRHRVGQAHDLERDLLFRSAAGLLPFERDDGRLLAALRVSSARLAAVASAPPAGFEVNASVAKPWPRARPGELDVGAVSGAFTQLPPGATPAAQNHREAVNLLSNRATWISVLISHSLPQVHGSQESVFTVR